MDTHKSPMPMDSISDPSNQFEYGQEIYEFMHEQEQKFVLQPMFLEAQKEVTWKMRKMLILWLIEVHLEYGLCQETLFLTIYILDRITSKLSISSQQYQLVGIASLWVASKYEENHGRVPSLKNLCFISCQTFTEKEILAMERIVLKNIHYDLSIPTPASFVHAHCHVAKCEVSLQVKSLATYILEVCLVHKRFIGQKSSFLAKSSLILAHDILGKRDWFHADACLLECARHMSNILIDPPKIVFKKHATPKYFHSSFVAKDWIERQRFMQASTLKIEPMGLVTPPKDPEWIQAQPHWQQIALPNHSHYYAYPIYSTYPSTNATRGLSCIW